MKYNIGKDLTKMIPKLIQRGGNFQKAGQKVAEILTLIRLPNQNPLAKIPLTNHGESRIKYCLKYDLSGFCRLITIQNNGCCFLMFVGDHDECESWLERNKGLNVALNPKSHEFDLVYKSEDINVPEKRISDAPNYIPSNLLSRLGDHYFEKISDKIPFRILRELETLNESSDEDRIMEIAQKLNDPETGALVFDIFILVKAGSIDEAKNRISQYQDELKLLEELNQEELLSSKSNNLFKNSSSLTDEDIQILMNGKSWLDWMLFMHPDQSDIVTTSLSGTARLLGVSGSGKTAIVVRRAIHLATKYSREKILIITLNRSLSKLISKLIDIYCESVLAGKELRSRITVSSYWEVCKDILINVYSDRNKKKSWDDFSDKHEDSIEEVWSEFYQCEENNDDAKILLPIHQSLLQRGVFPIDYIKQEFDWVRSAVSNNERHKYLDIEREGRSIPFPSENRKQILEGLNHWEGLMRHVGISDYLGLTQELIDLLNDIKPQYRCVLVDEIQDFGTLELKIIRQLVSENEDDLFLSGDIAQQVYTKHHKITQAGIRIQPGNYLTILKNYRNSREILAAAYQVFKSNTTSSSFELDDFKVLQPEFANFSSPKPFIRASSSMQNEFNFAITYLKELLEDDQKGCIALAGYSYYDVLKIGKIVSVPVLDGSIDLTGHNIFISDLEQTKGFEFDRMIVINCSESIIPNPIFPPEEWFRDISKLYVAMTRAKFELILSYSGKASALFDNCGEYFTHDKWIDHLAVDKISTFKIPDPSVDAKSNGNGSLTGLKYMYTKGAIGLSLELQDKLIELVDGRYSSDERGNRLKWRNMNDLITDMNSGRSTPNLARKFGPIVFKELQTKFGSEISIIVR